jgi:hypothetical protein
MSALVTPPHTKKTRQILPLEQAIQPTREQSDPENEPVLRHVRFVPNLMGGDSI